jgi:peptide/nickel transport system permease protein
MYPPGIAILLTALTFNMLGESLRDILDPTLKRN